MLLIVPWTWKVSGCLMCRVGLCWTILWIVGNVMESCLNGFGLIIYLDLNVIGMSSHIAKEGC